VILRGLPEISGRGGGGTLEGPGSVEVIPLSLWGSGAAPSVEWAALRQLGLQVWPKAPRGRWMCLHS
jgi:hypothetical protein